MHSPLQQYIVLAFIEYVVLLCVLVIRLPLMSIYSVVFICMHALFSLADE